MGQVIDSTSGRWNERLDSETNGPRIVPNANPANVYDLAVGGHDGCASHNTLLTTVFNSVLPRDAQGRPVNPITRFPQVDSADRHNDLVAGEIAALVV